MSEDIQRLVDRAKIQDVLTSYAISVDMCDWPRLRSIFSVKIERDLSSFTGQPSETIDSEQHVNECRFTLPGFDSTQHFLLNNEITIDGDQATAIVYMIADHTLVENQVQKQFTIRGFYTYRLIRNDTNWEICGMMLKVLSTQGDQSIFQIAAKRTEAMEETQRDALR